MHIFCIAGLTAVDQAGSKCTVIYQSKFVACFYIASYQTICGLTNEHNPSWKGRSWLLKSSFVLFPEWSNKEPICWIWGLQNIFHQLCTII